MNDEFDRFDDALREWATRPPRTTGAEAARVVTAAIRRKRRHRVVRWSGLAAAAALVIAMSTNVLRRPQPPAVVVAAAGEIRTAGLADGVVLMWLDDETPLYMTFQAEARGIAGQGDAP